MLFCSILPPPILTDEFVVTGPSHWGRASMMFSDDIWPTCSKGRLQSPINIRLNDLIFDRTLKPLNIDGISSEVRPLN